MCIHPPDQEIRTRKRMMRKKSRKPSCMNSSVSREVCSCGRTHERQPSTPKAVLLLSLSLSLSLSLTVSPCLILCLSVAASVARTISPSLPPSLSRTLSLCRSPTPKAAAPPRSTSPTTTLQCPAFISPPRCQDHPSPKTCPLNRVIRRVALPHARRICAHFHSWHQAREGKRGERN